MDLTCKMPVQYYPIARKWGSELERGDVVSFLNTDRTITGFSEHTGQPDARIVESGSSWSITVFNTDCFRRLSNGVWILSHAWWSHPLGRGL